MRTCSICTNAKVNEINEALLRNDSFRHIASRFGTSTAALQRHKTAHVPQTLVKAKEAVEEVQADSLYEQLKGLNRQAHEILGEARKSGKLPTALMAINSAAKLLEIQAKMLGELDESAKIAVGVQVKETAATEGWDPDRLELHEVQQLAWLWEKGRRR